jgi:glycosyltransferase involved in cell wall biosynthesis
MTILSIITINYNNFEGLKKTINSVLSQTSSNFEYIIIDGGSIDQSKTLIEQSAKQDKRITYWVSEPDMGIYHAMNKGIIHAKGAYIQILNSGDYLAKEVVTEHMLKQTFDLKSSVSILYGNMLKQMPDGLKRDRCFAGKPISFLGMYTGTLNHSPAYIKRELFEKYGLYDENLKIVSDWKWYLKSIIIGGEYVAYADIDVTVFDMNGISNVNIELNKKERQQVLATLFPPLILQDYEQWAFPINQIKTLQRYHWPYQLMWFVERCLFKYEQWFKNKEQIYR